MLLKPDKPKYWQTLLKMVVCGVCMNLQVKFVIVASSFAWTITSILIQIAPEDQTKGQDLQLQMG